MERTNIKIVLREGKAKAAKTKEFLEMFENCGLKVLHVYDCGPKWYLTYFLVCASTMMNRVLIGIAGGSGSGKTTIDLPP